MACAFHICSLTQSWHGVDIPTPQWLTALNALALAFGIIANLALLFRMGRRLPFTVANTLIISGWYISSFLLTSIIVAASYLPRGPSTSKVAFTQAVYYAIMAAALQVTIATMMLIAAWGAYTGRHGREFKLTMGQRTLMLQTVSFVIYLLGGAAVFSRIEGWAFLDAVYWADYTLLTIGIGNYAPATHLGRILLFPYATGGIVTLGLLVGSIYSMGLQQGKKRFAARMFEQERERMVKRIDQGKLHLTPFSTGHDRKRQQEEFVLMRRVQEKAGQRRRWIFFLVPAGAWLFLWMIGAAIFWTTETHQHWSYFESLYFAYVSLMTIGYGSFYPESNAGKPFYVFWSLLAIPILTILISSLEDTVAVSIRDLTLLIGEFTILPGDVSPKNRLRQALKKAIERKKITIEQGIEGSSQPSQATEDSGERQDVSNPTCNHSAGGELDEGSEHAKNHDGTDGYICPNRICHALLLGTEIRTVMGDLHASPPRQYTYAEWTWFLKLIGEDETSPGFGRRTSVSNQSESQRALVENHGEQGQQLSWLGTQSALMCDKEEAEWVMHRLSLSLERELKAEREAQRERVR